MFNNTALDVFIGLLAIFLLYSLLASILMEALAKYCGLRQRITLKAISQLLENSEHSFSLWFTQPVKLLAKCPFTALFYAHPNISNLGHNRFNSKPSAISAEMFADTLIQLLRGDVYQKGNNQIDMMVKNLHLDSETDKGTLTLPEWYKKNHEHKRKHPLCHGGTGAIKIEDLTVYQLEQFIFDVNSDSALLRKKLVNWYNEMMDRAEGWYIKQTRGLLFCIGLLIAGALNVDAVHIAQQLANDKNMRDNMVTFASHIQKDTPIIKQTTQTDSALQETFKHVNESYKQSGTIIGGYQAGLGETFWLGWLITAFAISLGAPFWFDLLGKLMCIRQGGNSSVTDNQSKLDIAKNNTKEPIG